MRSILIVDDSKLERALLGHIVKQRFDVLEADSGEEMVSVLRQKGMSISAIILDIVMPGMDGYEALKRIRGNAIWRQIPVIVATALSDDESQIKALAYGANGFVSKPFKTELLLYTLQNAIDLHEKSSLLNTMRSDPLTGLQNRDGFFHKAKYMIDREPPGHYVLVSLNIESFSVINDLYGAATGDAVLKHVAKRISSSLQAVDGICCRLFADQFGMLFPASYMNSRELKECYDQAIAPDCLDHKIKIRIGRFVVDDLSLSVNTIYDRAALAADSVRNRYDTYLAEYDTVMRDKRLREQKIIIAMSDALASGEFEPWFQPQYNHATGAMVGAEALVRWRKGDKLIPPDDFIPVFERSGFIYKMDQYIWRQVCALLRRWLDEGRAPLPISINVSRYDLFQPDFVAVLCGLMREYDLPCDLLRVEVTESAFSASQDRIIETVTELIDFGFTVEIDDFGSGYSSLNTLKNVPASILKLDMKFLGKTDNSKRGGSILESIVRMAKWIGMSVIAEGVEKATQADYLMAIGCSYIQGYLYAKPMPASEYEALLVSGAKEAKMVSIETLGTLNSNEFWNPESMETLIFNSYVGGAAIIEYSNGKAERIRANQRFSLEFDGATIGGVPLYDIPPEECLDEENLRIMYENMMRSTSLGTESTCEICIGGLDSETSPTLYLRCTLRAIAWANERSLLYCVISNVTAQRMAEKKQREISTEVLDNLPCGAGLYEYDGAQLHAIYLNRQYWELVGRKRWDFNDLDVMTSIHPADRGKLLPEISDALMQKRDAVINIRIRYGNAEYRRFHIVVQILKKREGLYSLYGVFIPVSEDSLLLEAQNNSKRDRDRLNFIFKNAAISVWSYNLKTGEVIQNERSRRMHGFGSVVAGVPESLVESGYVHPDSVEAYLAMYQRLKDGAKEAEGVFRVRTADRAGYWFEHVRYAAISGGGDQEDIVFGISNDVTVEHEQDSAIRQWMAVISEMQVENSAICEFNLTRDTFIRKQGSLFPPFKASEDDSFDHYILTWARQFVFADDANKVIEFLRRDNLLAMRARGVLDGGIDYRAVIGSKIRWCSLSIKFIKYLNDDDVRLVMVHTDIHSRKEDELRLIDENRRDPLTGVLNRKAFERQVDKLLLAAPDAYHSMFMIDLDNFKEINDKFGHVIGDSVLVRTAEGLRSLLRSDDLVGRVGGDEFMVFLKSIQNRSVIHQRAQKILDLMHASLNLNVEVSVSLGVAIAPKDGHTFAELYNSADKAVYYSKQHGKNRATFFETDIENAATYGGTISQIDFDNSPESKAWAQHAQSIIAENQRLIERQEEDERYRLVIENTHIVTFEWNAETGKFVSSPDFEEYVLSRQGGEQLFSENVDATGVHPDDRALFYGRFLEKVLSGETAQETSLRLALRSGGYRWCRLSAIVTFDKLERLSKAIGIITAENVQRDQADTRFASAFKHMCAGVMLVEIQKSEIKTRFVSESYLTLDSADEIDAKNADPLHGVHPDDYQRVKHNLIICAVSGSVMEETFRVSREGKPGWRHVKAVRIPYEDAINPVMVIVETDITNIRIQEK